MPPSRSAMPRKVSTKYNSAGALRKSWGSKVDPLLADPNVPYNSRALIDACRPFEKLETFPRVAQSSPARVREAVAKWKDLFADPRFPLPETVIPSGAVDEKARG